MSQPVGYAADWLEIATEIKQAAGYRCLRCGLRCLSGSNSYRHLDLSLWRRLCAQVHHIDSNPSHNFAIDISSAGDRSVPPQNAPPSPDSDTRAISTQAEATKESSLAAEPLQFSINIYRSHRQITSIANRVERAA